MRASDQPPDREWQDAAAFAAAPNPAPPEEAFDFEDYWQGVRACCDELLEVIHTLDDDVMTAVHLGLMDPQLELEACVLTQVLLATRPALVRLRDRAAKEGE